MGRRLVDLIIIQTVRCNIFAPRSIDVEIALMFLSLSTIESIDLTRFDLSFFLFFSFSFLSELEMKKRLWNIQ